MNIYMYVYIYIQIYMHIYIYIHTHMNIYRNETASVPSVSSLSVYTTEMGSGSYMRGIYMYILYIYVHKYESMSKKFI
jgi:hypothetical protein